MTKKAVLSLGVIGSRPPHAELGLGAPDLPWEHVWLSSLERWGIPEGVHFEKIYLDLRSFPAPSLGAPDFELEAWKASLNAFLARLVYGEGKVPFLIGYCATPAWEHARSAVRLGAREILTLSEIGASFTSSQQNASPEGEIIAFPRGLGHESGMGSANVPHRLPSAPLPFPIDGLEGHSLAIETVRSTIRKAAPTSASVLIIGPTGSGKERVAHALHRYSDRAWQPLRVLDCAAINSDIFESELFGHVSGAFTHAREDRKGTLELAHLGVLYIDQIHLLAMEQQSKLLRALQERKFSPVGSSETRSVDIRVIASSQVPLEELVHAGKFREDLYFRLKVIDVVLPALSERRPDIPVIAESLLKKLSKQARRQVPSLHPAAMEQMLLYGWPGNVRELGNALERACALAWGEQRDEILPQDLPDSIQFAIMDTFKTAGLKEAVRRFEKEHIAQTIRRLGGSKEDAADALGLSLATLYRKLGGE